MENSNSSFCLLSVHSSIPQFSQTSQIIIALLFTVLLSIFASLTAIEHPNAPHVTCDLFKADYKEACSPGLVQDIHAFENCVNGHNSKNCDALITKFVICFKTTHQGSNEAHTTMIKMYLGTGFPNLASVVVRLRNVHYDASKFQHLFINDIFGQVVLYIISICL